MLKIYIDTVIIYFVIYMETGILFRKNYIKSRDKVRKELNDNSKNYGVIRTTITYLIISFIPFIRVIGLLGKLFIILNPDEYIKICKEQKEDKE